MLGTKIGMTQIFDAQGLAIPITVIQVGPCIITQIKNVEKDGYNAIQLGYSRIHANCLTKADIGHLNKATTNTLRYLSEHKVHSIERFHLGDSVTVTQFKIGQLVNISGKTIGQGFAGYQKRHHFSRGPMTHGSKNHRQPGSIGPGTTPGRVFPGKRMAGRSGNKTVTVKNLQIIDIDTSQHLMLIKGSVPGANGNLLRISSRSVDN